MSKQDFIVTEGTVLEVLPNALFKVKLDDQDHSILCHLSGKIRMNNINVRLMDRVEIEISVYDMSKGRITFRHKPNFLQNKSQNAKK